MANNQITKEEIKKLMEIPGKVRGVVFLTDLEYVKEKKGEKRFVISPNTTLVYEVELLDILK